MWRIWQKRGVLACALWPFSQIYRLLSEKRRRQWLTKPLPRFAAPVIVVGNITVGGAGKTPCVIALVKHLQAQGWRPGVVSRGYGGSAQSYPQFVQQESTATQVGDEPVLIKQKTNCPVVVDPNRYRGVQFLLEQTDCNVVLSDDGLQHYGLPRDIEIAVVDGTRAFGNGWCLPAGPLREPVERLARVDYIVVKNPKKPTVHTGMRLKPEHFYPLSDPQNKQALDHFAGQKIHAAAGIANPASFTATLAPLCQQVLAHRFSDHCVYTPKQRQFLSRLEGPVVFTEKDAVKLREGAAPNWWVLATTSDFDGDFLNQLTSTLSTISQLPN